MQPFSQVLAQLAQDSGRPRVSVADLLNLLGDRAIGALMFVFAVPNILPVPPGVSAILGLPLVFLSAQLMLGRPPWLPAVVMQRSLAREDFDSLTRRVSPWLLKAERLLRPRHGYLAKPPMEYLIGAVCLVLSLVLALPIPLGNALPAVAISLLALGVLERDGLWILGGFLASVVAATVVSGVVFALVKAGAFLVRQVLS